MQARISIAGNSKSGILLQLYLPTEWCALFGERLGFDVLGEGLHADWGDEHGEERTRGKRCQRWTDVESEMHYLRIALRDAMDWARAEPIEQTIYINLDSAPTSEPGNGGNNG